jgi:predicted nuclease of predicted toxin-antitoxin system
MRKISWRLPSRRLKLMIDYNLGRPVADELNKLGRSVKAKTITEYGFKQDAKDADLIQATVAQKCILLTRDKRSINETIYRPCTHGGIIIIKQQRASVSDIRGYIKAFCESGKRSLAIHGVTHLYKNHAVIHTHAQEPRIVQL